MTKTPTRLLLKIVAIGFVSSILMLFLAFFFFPINYQNSIASIIDKNSSLKNSASRKVVLIGGSSVAFGFESELIADSFKTNVCNMGVQYGMGLNFMLNNVEPYVRDSDIIIISPEIQQFATMLYGNYALMKTLKYNFKEYIHYVNLFSWRQLDVFARNFPIFASNKFSLYLENVETKDNPNSSRHKSFNKYGDFIGYDEGINQKEEILKSSLRKYDDKYVKQLSCNQNRTIEYINNFAEKLKRKYPSAIVLFCPCHVPKLNYETNRKELDLLFNNIDSGLKIPVIGKFEDFFYDTNSFYDSIYHLKRNSRIERTKKVICLLKDRNII